METAQIPRVKVYDAYPPNEFLKQVKIKDEVLLEKYAKKQQEVDKKDLFSRHSARIEYALENKDNMPVADFELYERFISTMYEWNRTKVAYNYSEEIMREVVGNIDDLPLEAKHFTELPFLTFYFQRDNEWDIHGIFVNIREMYVLDTPKRLFEICAFALKPEDTIDTIDLDEADISFKVYEGDTPGSFYPGGDDWYPVDYFEGRDGELRYHILYMCYLLYKVSHSQVHEKKHSDKRHVNIFSEDFVDDWDVEHRIVYDDLDIAKEVNVTKEVVEDKTEEEQAAKQTTKKRKSPRAHTRRGTKGHRWCGKGDNKYLKEVWVRGSFPNAKKNKSDIPVVEHREK
ncbi:MAG: hypothetical protein IJS47_06420 [Clostridia bacterium]|nr:hypothetical protein [Clostridia bacterium]